MNDVSKMSTVDILILGPEILLIAYALGCILVASYLKSDKTNNFIFISTVILFLITALILYLTPF